MLKQCVIQFAFPGKEKRSAEFYRGFLARSGQKKLPNILFWREENGQSICETPMIRWVASHKGFSIVASEEYEDLLNETSSQLMAELLQSELNEFKVSRYTRVVNIEEVDDLLTYKADRVLYDASPKKVKEFMEADEAGRKELLEEYLKKELIREAECWDADDSFFNECEKHIRVSQVKMLAPAKVKDKATREVKRMISRYAIRFTMPIRLTGTWQVGRQRSKGYGVIHLNKGEWL